jgi:hypothetical protein
LTTGEWSFLFLQSAIEMRNSYVNLLVFLNLGPKV